MASVHELATPKRARGALLLLVLGATLAIVGCSGTHDARVRANDAPHAMTPSLPLEAARAKLSEARTHDATVRLGFYQVPLPFDAEEDSAAADLRREVSPASWGTPGHEVYRDGPWLVAIHTPEVQRAIAAWAKERRATDLASRQLVETEVRVLMFDRDSAAPLVARLGLEPVSADDGTSAFLVDPSQVASIIEARGVRAVSAPRVVSHSGQRASVAILNQHAYIADYEVYQLEDAVIADPQIDVLQEGISLEVTATLEPETIRLETAVHLAELLAMETTEVVVDPTLDPVHLDLPQVWMSQVATTARISDGHALLFGPDLAGASVDLRGAAAEVPWVLVLPKRVDPVR